MSFGFSYESVLSMDVVSFDDLVRMVNRIRSSQQADQVMLMHYAAQGTTTQVKEIVKKISG